MNYDKYDLKENGIDTEVVKPVQGQNAVRTLCPRCSAGRKTPAHRREAVLYVNLDNGVCHCHNCGEEWRMDSREYLSRREKAIRLVRTQTTYSRPKLTKPLDGTFSKEMERYLTETRGLPMEVVRQMKLSEQEEYMPQTGRKENCLVFNYMEQGFLINRKYRDMAKNFKMVQGAELIPYNVDSCLGEEEVIVVEGEFDVLAMVAAGFHSVISIPSGANANTTWMNRFYDLYFADKKRVYIATDMDAPGQQAAEELIRRFGPEVCLRVHFSEGCKDANDELLRTGKEGLQQRISEAMVVPIPDITTMDTLEGELDAYYQNGPTPGQRTGWQNLDSIVSFGTGQLALITGRSNDGKSEFLDELVLRLMIRSGWNVGYWSPENTLMDHTAKIIEKLCDRSFARRGTQGVQPDQFVLCKRWMKERMSWVTLPFDKLQLTTILDRCRSLVRKYGIRLLVLDPYNFIEKENDRIRSENAWDSYVIGAIRSFAIKYDVLVFLVAHPRKVEMQVDGRKRRITMEDISGTADFGNKADYCFCIDRDDEHHVVTLSVDKVRRKRFGSKGRQAFFVYKTHSGRYCPCEVDENRQPQNTDFKTDAGLWLSLPNLFGETGKAG